MPKCNRDCYYYYTTNEINFSLPRCSLKECALFPVGVGEECEHFIRTNDKCQEIVDKYVLDNFKKDPLIYMDNKTKEKD